MLYFRTCAVGVNLW